MNYNDKAVPTQICTGAVCAPVLDRTTCPNYCFQVHFIRTQRVYLSRGRQNRRGERPRVTEIQGERERGLKERKIERRTSDRRSFQNSRSWNVGGRCHIAPNICCSVGTATGQPMHLLANPSIPKSQHKSEDCDMVQKCVILKTRWLSYKKTKKADTVG